MWGELGVLKNGGVSCLGLLSCSLQQLGDFFGFWVLVLKVLLVLEVLVFACWCAIEGTAFISVCAVCAWPSASG